MGDQGKAKQPRSYSDEDVYPDLNRLGPLNDTIAKQNEEWYKKTREKVARDVLGSGSISTFMELPSEKKNKKYMEKLVTKGWIIAWDENLDYYPLGSVHDLIERRAEVSLGKKPLVDEARRVFWRENAFHVMNAMVPLWELLARPGAKENIARIQIDVQVPLNEEDREDTWKGIRGLEECTGLRWVFNEVEGSPSDRVEVGRCVEDMRELFEQVAMKCQPEKGLHVVTVERYPGSDDGTDTIRSVVDGAWIMYGRDDDGECIREVLAETSSRRRADARLRRYQDDL